MPQSQPQPFPDPKRKRRQTNPNKQKSNKRTNTPIELWYIFNFTEPHQLLQHSLALELPVLYLSCKKELTQYLVNRIINILQQFVIRERKENKKKKKTKNKKKSLEFTFASEDLFKIL